MRTDRRSLSPSFLSVFGSSVAIASLAWALVGCNSVTGAGELRFVDRSDNNETTTGGAGGAGGGGAGTGGMAPSACVYPAMNQGNEIGQIVKESFKWDGFPENSAVLGQVVPSDYFDCDGTKGINAVMVLKSALWCGACQQEASQLNTEMDTKWKAMGIRVLTLMLDDAQPGTPATTDTAQKWKSMFKLESTAVAVDPNVMTMVPAGVSSIGLPYGIIIDPRTMEIMNSQDGAAGLFGELEALATKNAGM